MRVIAPDNEVYNQKMMVMHKGRISEKKLVEPVMARSAKTRNLEEATRRQNEDAWGELGGDVTPAE